MSLTMLDPFKHQCQAGTVGHFHFLQVDADYLGRIQKIERFYRFFVDTGKSQGALNDKIPRLLFGDFQL